MTRKKKIPDNLDEPVVTDEIEAFPEPDSSFQLHTPVQAEIPAQPDDSAQPSSFIQLPASHPPNVQLIFDKTVAEKWLGSSWLRLRNIYASLRFEPQGMPANQVSFCLYLAVCALKPYGVLYVPMELAESPHLAKLIRGETNGEYAVFTRL